MTPGITVGLVVVLVGGVAAILVGLRLVDRSRGAAAPIPEHTDARARLEIIDRAVFLAVELARVDGAIGEAEIACIERFLVDRFGLAPDEAASTVHRMLRATQHDAGARSALDDIARLADRPHRKLVVELLEATAASDAAVADAEAAVLKQVIRRLGPA